MSGIGESVSLVSGSGDAYVDGLLFYPFGYRWSGGSITYSFPTSSTGYSYTGPVSTFSPVSGALQAAARFALDANAIPAASWGFTVEGFTNLSISASNAPKTTLRFGLTSDGAFPTAAAYTPYTNDRSGDIWFNKFDYNNPVAGNYAWHTVIHEIGHALGLKHGHDFLAIPTSRDTMEYSVMTYHSYQNSPIDFYHNEEWGFAQTWMMLDIAALQHMYGADFTTNSGNTVYKWNPSTGTTYVNGTAAINPGANRIFATIWDGGGIDTYDLSAYVANLVIDLRPGQHSLFSAVQLAYLGDNNYARGNIFNALQYNGDLRSLIENAIGGTGADRITGNDANNTLQGGAGNDQLFGGAGNDTLDGGAGADKLDGGFGTDFVSYATSRTAVGVRLDGIAGFAGAAGDILANIEDLRGSEFNDILVGSSSDNELHGGAGNDSIWGGAGNDEIDGGLGADKIDGGAGDDVVSYVNADSGVDIRLDRTPGMGGAAGDMLTNIERLIGSRFNDILVGSSGANVLEGGTGNDTLNGGGGDDLMDGGSGADAIDGEAGIDVVTYITSVIGVGARLDGIAGFGGAFGDTILNFEQLIGSNFNDVLVGSGNGDKLEGRAGNDTIWGGAGDDTIEGGTGLDKMDGGAGNDIVSYVTTLGGVGVRLDGGVNFGAATGDITTNFEGVLGSNFDDVLIGSSNGDILDGRGGRNTIWGGAGNDQLYGGGGDDTINGGTGDDRIDAGFGSDTIDGGSDFDTVVYSRSEIGVAARLDGLAGFGEVITNVEKLIGSNFNDVLVGSANGDTLDGGAGNDTLWGGNGTDILTGGMGNDLLSGGTGADRFLYFDTNGGTDTISDFRDGEDVIDLSGLGLTFASIVLTDLGGTDTQVNFGAVTITLRGVNAASISAADFDFV